MEDNRILSRIPSTPLLYFRQGAYSAKFVPNNVNSPCPKKKKKTPYALFRLCCLTFVLRRGREGYLPQASRHRCFTSSILGVGQQSTCIGDYVEENRTRVSIVFPNLRETFACTKHLENAQKSRREKEKRKRKKSLVLDMKEEASQTLQSWLCSG